MSSNNRNFLKNKSAELLGIFIRAVYESFTSSLADEIGNTAHQKVEELADKAAGRIFDSKK